ncbi:hypothetical protein J4V27_26210, partial [Escherichia coli]
SNLYVLFTPLLPGDNYSSLEDFFEPKVLQMKYNGKSFDKSNKKKKKKNKKKKKKNKKKKKKKF